METRGWIGMGACHSAQGGKREIPAGDHAVVDDYCPTVFALEQAAEMRRGRATRMHVNLVNIEFRRGLFEMYVKGETGYVTSDSEDGGGGGGGGAGGGGGGGRTAALENENKEMFVATHKVSCFVSL